MNSRRTLIAISSAFALTILSACHIKKLAPPEKPVVKYVDSKDLTLNDYVEPGQKLEWRVHGPQSPSFTFKPQDGLCEAATIHERATHHNPAGCVVAQQTYPSGTQMNIYRYTLTSDGTTSAEVQGGIVPRVQAKTPTSGPSPAPPPVTYILRVGSCGGC
jgi:hypothetical protein